MIIDGFGLNLSLFQQAAAEPRPVEIPRGSR